ARKEIGFDALCARNAIWILDLRTFMSGKLKRVERAARDDHRASKRAKREPHFQKSPSRCGDEPQRSHGKCVSNRAKYKLCTHGSGEFRARGGIIVRGIQKSTIFLRRSGELAANETAARQ